MVPLVNLPMVPFIANGTIGRATGTIGRTLNDVGIPLVELGTHAISIYLSIS